MAETAATDATQRHFANNLRKESCHTCWSVPVLPAKTTVTSQPHTRGKASGVGLISKFPIRLSRNTSEDPFVLSSRYLHCVVKAGPVQIQVVTLYCKTASANGAARYNNGLLNFALEQINKIALPYIILGDFNCPIPSLEAWPHLEHLGCQHLGQIHSRIYGTPMEPTCMGSTTPDNGIISPELVQYVQKVAVLPDGIFATHRPVLFKLTFPHEGLFKEIIRTPKEIVQLGLEKSDLNAAHYLTKDQRPTPKTIEEWGVDFETVVDTAMNMTAKNGNLDHLPRAFRGRCQPNQTKKCPILGFTKKAKNGQYEPSCEVLSMASQRKITQLRRLQSLCARLKKVSPETDQKAHQSMQQEWLAIVKSTSFGTYFLSWLQAYNLFSFPAWPLPSYEWLHEVTQFVKFEVDAALMHEKQCQANREKYARELDKKFGNSKAAFRRVRGPQKPSVTQICHHIETEVIVVPHDNDNLEIFLEREHIKNISLAYPVKINQQVGHVANIDVDSVMIHMDQPWNDQAETATFCHTAYWISQKEVATKLNEFWQPIWQRDTLAPDFLDQPNPYHGILQVMPNFGAMHADLHNLEAWKEAVHRLKPNSARGIDMISAQEIKLIPDDMLSALADILTSYHHGFPQWFMIGITCPKSKVESCPSNNQTRPITILAQLYRLWSSVIYRMAIKHIAHQIPAGVTGLLPGRGSNNAAYHTQFFLESSRLERQPKCGLTLDIQKCYNNINQVFGYFLLLCTGIPREIARQWAVSLTRLQRLWCINHSNHDAGFATTGYPEGDTMSVLIMISLATLWTCSMLARTRRTLDISLSAYADNWGWIVNHHDGITQGITTTLIILDAAKLQIDWGKTWFFSTCNSTARTIAEMLLPFTPHPVERKTSANDLGYQMQYSGQSKLGVIKTRLENGTARLDRLRLRPHDVEVKEHMLQSSIFPAMFYGCDIRPISSDSLEAARSKAAHALCGENTNMSPAIVLAITQCGIMDPEFWCIKHTVFAAKRFLAKQSQEMISKFLEHAATFRGNLAQVRGPASCLAFCLNELGWSITKTGDLLATPFISIPILHASFNRIEKFLTRAWQTKLVMLKTNKKSLFHMPDMDIQETTKVLKSFEPQDRLFLMKEISGAYQTNQQKAKWNSDIDSTCQFCPAEDTKEHRLLTCPIGQSIRENYQDLLQTLETTGTTMPSWPVISVHPAADAIQVMHFKQPETELMQAVAPFLRAQPPDSEIHWFTDGSCFHPTCPTKFAAYSIILDLCQSNREREYLANQHRYLKLHPPSLKVVAANRCQGEQDILRAEMSAIADIICKCGRGVIHTDSQTAITLCNLAMDSQLPLHFATCAHSDILFKIWTKGRQHCSLEKIKAHVNISEVAEATQRYFHMGNALANDAAQQACANLLPNFVTELQELHRDMQVERDMFKALCHLHLELRTARQQAEMASTPDEQAVQHTENTILLAFCSWSLPHHINYTGMVNTTFLQFGTWGQATHEALLRWSRTLQWPTEADESPLKKGCGISWIELAFSFMMYSQQYLPVVRKTAEGEERVLCVGSWQSAHEYSITSTELGTNMQKALDNTIAMIPEVFFPNVKRRKVSSLYLQGAGRFTQGLHMRPVLPNQAEVANLIHQHVKETNGKFHTAPNFNFNSADTMLPSLWKERNRLGKLRMITVRKARAELGGG
jgi:hypothetical protein